jgi:hypothetical protein
VAGKRLWSSQHATKHFYATGYPIVSSFEPDENWMWCFVDEVILPAQQYSQ